jgi:hypothetical protein
MRGLLQLHGHRLAQNEIKGLVAANRLEKRIQHGHTLLQAAVLRGKTKIVKLMLENKGEVNARFGGRTLLIAAAHQGHDDVTRLLIKRKADVNLASECPRDEGFTPLMWAAYRGSLGSVKELVAAGCDIRLEDTRYKETALTKAKSQKKPKIVSFLKKAIEDSILDEKMVIKEEDLEEQAGVHPGQLRKLLAYGKGPYKRFRLTLVGKGRAGKTKLYHSLQDIKWVEGEESTHVAETQECNLECKLETKSSELTSTGSLKKRDPEEELSRSIGRGLKSGPNNPHVEEKDSWSDVDDEEESASEDEIPLRPIGRELQSYPSSNQDVKDTRSHHAQAEEPAPKDPIPSLAQFDCRELDPFKIEMGTKDTSLWLAVSDWGGQDIFYMVKSRAFETNVFES